MLGDFHQRIQCTHRLLEDHGDLLTAQLRHLAVGQPEQLTAVESNRAGSAQSLRQKPDDGQSRQGLSRTRFPDETNASTAGNF